VKYLIPNRRFIVSLIGTNPLPAFITILKNYHENTKIFLIYTEYSESNVGSKIIAENLKVVLEEKIPGIDVSLMKCDKSNTRIINGCIKDLLKCIETLMDENKCELILDYTSGTKAMSAIFAEKVLHADIENLSTYISYVDDNQNVILEDTKLIGKSSIVLVRDAVRNMDVSIEDVVRIHGYKISNPVKENMDENNIRHIDGPIVFENNIGNRISADEVYLIDCKIAVCFKSRYFGMKERVGKLKMELFEYKDKAEKLGGNRSIILYKSDCDEGKKGLLLRYLKRDYEFEMDKRLFFVNEDESFKDRIKRMYV